MHNSKESHLNMLNVDKCVIQMSLHTFGISAMSLSEVHLLYRIIKLSCEIHIVYGKGRCV